MPHFVDFKNVATAGLESSPVANEARYFKNKYDHDFTVEPATKAKKAVAWVHRILKEEREIVIESPPLEATLFQVENIRMSLTSALAVAIPGRCCRTQAAARTEVRRA